MFERFGDDARRVVIGAHEEARRLRDGYIGSAHLLLGIAAADGPGGVALREVGIDHPALDLAVRDVPSPTDELDAEALAAIGIDLDAVRERTDATFGAGSLDRAAAADGARRRRRRRRGRTSPFSADARETLETSLREAVDLGHLQIDSGHLLLAVVRLQDTPAHRALLGAGAEPELVRQAVIRLWSGAT